MVRGWGGGGRGEGRERGGVISKKIPAQLHNYAEKKNRARGEKNQASAFCYLYFDFWC